MILENEFTTKPSIFRSAYCVGIWRASRLWFIQGPTGVRDRRADSCGEKPESDARRSETFLKWIWEDTTNLAHNIEIDNLHATYCQKLVDLFDKHKANYGIDPEERIILYWFIIVLISDLSFEFKENCLIHETSYETKQCKLRDSVCLWSLDYDDFYHIWIIIVTEANTAGIMIVRGRGKDYLSSTAMSTAAAIRTFCWPLRYLKDADHC